MDNLEGAQQGFIPVAFVVDGVVVEMIGANPGLASALFNNPTIVNAMGQDVKPGCLYTGTRFDCSKTFDKGPKTNPTPQPSISEDTKDMIYVAIPAYNEEDLILTISTCLNEANDPSKVVIGVAMQYTNGQYPDLGAYPHLRSIRIDEPVGIGTCPTRDLAASMMNGEEYYLQIDAHTVFKKNWDVILKSRYKELKKEYDKPIISTYVPYWYKDKETGKFMGMGNNEDFTLTHTPWALQFKHTVEEAHEFDTVFSADALCTPNPLVVTYDDKPYHEHHLTSGHFLFTESTFLDEVPFDPECTYHEENTTPMRAWTRGYRIFSIKEDVLWTREMFHGRDIRNSWRSKADESPEGETPFKTKVVMGTLRNKDILTGKVLGVWGAPTLELLEEYEKAAGVDYKEFYKKMYDLVEKDKSRFYASTALYELDKKVNG
jgi:hypothetical protein